MTKQERAEQITAAEHANHKAQTEAERGSETEAVQAALAWDQAAKTHRAEMEDEYGEHNTGVQANLDARARQAQLDVNSARSTAMGAQREAESTRRILQTAQATSAWVDSRAAIKTREAAEATERAELATMAALFFRQACELDTELAWQEAENALRLSAAAQMAHEDTKSVWMRARARMAKHKHETDAANGVGPLVRSVIDRHPDL